MKGITGYARVSTLRQVDGFSLAHQTGSIERFAAMSGRPLTKIYVEYESGKRHQNRPQFLAALEECKRTGNTLTCIRLDRLSRNSSFLMALSESKIDFYCIEQPDLSSPLVIGLLASIAQSEVSTLSSRVKSGIAQKRKECEAQGIPFFEAQRDHCRRIQAQGTQAIKEASLNRILERRASILGVYESNERSLSETSRKLNALRVPTLSGKGEWNPTSVRRVVLAGA